MEKLELIAEIEKQAVAAGIKQSKLDRNIQLSYLPERGKFSTYKIEGAGTTFAHIRLVTEDGHSISISALQALGFKGSKDEAKAHLHDLPKNEKTGFPGGWVLGGTSPINPHLGGKIAVVTANLVGSSFTRTMDSRIVLPIKTRTEEDGTITILGYTKEEAEAALVAKDFFCVTVVPELTK